MNILIFGATSDVAQELAKLYSKNGDDVTLLGIDTISLHPFQADIEVRYGKRIKLVEFDILCYTSPNHKIIELVQNSDISILLIGYLGDQNNAEQNDGELNRIVALNYAKVIEVINQIQRIYVRKQSGIIAGVSSVAGDRGKQSNFVYGSAKAGLSVYLDGLRNRLYPKGVHVITIKPGFMATKMTEDMDLPKPLTVSPINAAHSIIKAIENKKNIVYLNWIWKYLMVVIKLIPESVFKKMKM